MKRQDPRAYQTGGDDDRRRGGLDQCRDDNTEQEGFYRIVGHLFHDKPHGGAGILFQGISHQAHAVEEQGKAAEERDHI